MTDSSIQLSLTPHYLKAKRNALFWVCATIVLEAARTKSPIAPVWAGTSVALHPVVLSFMLMGTTFYHYVAYWAEIAVVKAINSPALINHQADWSARMQAERDQVARLTDGIVARAAGTFEIAKTLVAQRENQLVRERAKAAKLQEFLDLERRDPIKKDGPLDQTGTNAGRQRVKEQFEVLTVMSHPILQQDPIERLDDAPVDPEIPVLATKLNDFYVNWRKLSGQISISQRRMVRWHDQVIPNGLLIVATVMFVANLFLPQSIGCLTAAHVDHGHLAAGCEVSIPATPVPPPSHRLLSPPH